MNNECIQKFGKILKRRKSLLTSQWTLMEMAWEVLSLYHAFKNLGKDVRMILNGAVGQRYLFLPGAEKIDIGILKIYLR